jgi:peptidyl-dipeptidase A
MRLAALTTVALLLASPGLAQTPTQDRDHARTPQSRVQGAKPAVTAPAKPSVPQVATAKAAEDFIAKVEADLVAENEYSNRVSWIAANFITDDTNWLSAKVSAELGALAVARAKQAATFDSVTVDPITRRKLELLKKGLSLPPPDRPGAAEELADIETRLDTTYSTGKVVYQGREITLDDIEDIMRGSRDPA